MSNSLTLFNNTLIKLVSRSGTESQRQSVILDAGEFGYTTDSKRLYIGDGVTLGGSIVGNLFKGNASGITNIGGTPRAGDSAFDTASQTLYLYKSGATSTSALTSWQPVGGFYTSGNGTIVINSSNVVTVGSISANNISSDALGKSLTISTGRVTLSAKIAVDEIVTDTATNLKLPVDFQFGTNTYRLTASKVTGGYLRTDSFGNLEWSTANSLVSANSATLTLGSGLTGSYGGASSSQFPVSGNITISPLFSPIAHVMFSQSGVIGRQVRVASVAQIPVATALGAVPDIAGLPLSESTSRFDNAATGAYEITLEDTVNASTVVIDVNIRNGVYRYETTESGTVYSPTLAAYAYAPTNSTIRVLIYSVGTSIQQLVTSGRNTGSIAGSRTTKAVLTPGADSTQTMFSVSVY
jgi:hypothetical protein